MTKVGYWSFLIVGIVLLAGCTGIGPTTPETTHSLVSSPAVSPQGASPASTALPPAESTTSPTQRGPHQGTTWTVTITRVIDGDTVEARFPNGETDTLRLLGVDTPEPNYSRVSPNEFDGIPNNTAGRDHLLHWAERATNYTTVRLAGETVRIEVDPAADRRGGYGRLLVYLYLDDQNFNKQLLTNGYARLYESSFSLRAEFETTERTAQANNVGLWDFAE